MRDPLDPPIWAKILLILTVAALIIIGLATLTAPSCDPVTKPTVSLTSETWCRLLRDTGSTLSCDWDNPDLPSKALAEYETHPDISAEQATINAAKESEK